jgi:hypothetical protein
MLIDITISADVVLFLLLPICFHDLSNFQTSEIGHQKSIIKSVRSAPKGCNYCPNEFDLLATHLWAVAVACHPEIHRNPMTPEDGTKNPPKPSPPTQISWNLSFQG